jgi:hypothetical protein
MIKNILFYVLVTFTTLSHGMETILQDTNDQNILSCLTKHLYPNKPLDGYHKYDVYDLGKNINSLSRTNKFFHTYFSSEKTGQTIVTWVAHHTKDTDHAISFYLNRYKNIFKTIEYNIERLFKIVADPNKQFTKENLKCPWYVNATRGFGHHTTLLYEAYREIQVQKIKDLINAKANVQNSELLAGIVSSEHFKENRKEILTITQLLLENGADPNFYSNHTIPPLSKAILCKDKECAHLLLWYNANPYKTTTSRFFYRSSCGKVVIRGAVNAFSIEENDWFKPMVDEKQQIIFNCWLFKHHNLKKHKLLPEIIKIIKHKVWEISKAFARF